MGYVSNLLWEVLFKILKEVFPLLVSAFQAALGQSLKKVRKSGVVCKIDLEKAYDHVG